jgi:hypothetical protein
MGPSPDALLNSPARQPSSYRRPIGWKSWGGWRAPLVKALLVLSWSAHLEGHFFLYEHEHFSS